jgi:hypothetical protein
MENEIYARKKEENQTRGEGRIGDNVLAGARARLLPDEIDRREASFSQNPDDPKPGLVDPHICGRAAIDGIVEGVQS